MRAELDDFLNFCRVERRLAPLTCSAYERDVRACRAFLEAEGIHRWGEVRPPHLRRFLAAEAQRRPAASSQARTIAALKGFFRFLVENESIDRNPASVLRTPKKREALPDVLDQRERPALARGRARRRVGARARRQARARPAAAGAVRLRRPAPRGAARARRRRRRPGAPPGARAAGQGRPRAGRPDPPRARPARRQLPRDARAGRPRAAVRRRPGAAAVADGHDPDLPAPPG